MSRSIGTTGLLAVALAMILSLVPAGPSSASPTMDPPVGAAVELPQDPVVSQERQKGYSRVKITLISAPARTVWTSTRRTVHVPMTYKIYDPAGAAKRVRVCFEVVNEDDSGCKSHVLRNYSTKRGDFSIRRIDNGWEVYSAPFYRWISPATCNRFEYFRPRVKWKVSVVDPRDGQNLVYARFGWSVRCSG